MTETITDAPFSLSNVERQRRLVQLLELRGRLGIAEICQEFGVSEATARRDLETLAGQGVLQRVHGGAIKLRQATPEQPILDRSAEQADEKERIGRAAAALIQPGETIFLGSGTTVLAVARNLAECAGLTVITNSLPVINLFTACPQITLVSLGGILRQSELSFIGHITEQALTEVRVDRVLLGIRALSLEHGLTNDYLPETLTDRAILRCGREIIVVADHTKLDCVSTAFLAPLTSLDRLVTDSGAAPEFLAELDQRGIQVTAC